MSENRQEFIGSSEPEKMQGGTNLERQNDNELIKMPTWLSTILLIIAILLAAIIGYGVGRREQRIANSQNEQQFIKVADGLQEIDIKRLKRDSSYALKLFSNVERNNANAHIMNTIFYDSIAVENARATADRVEEIYNNMPKDSEYYEELAKVLEDHRELLKNLEEELEKNHELEEILENANKMDDLLNAIP